MNTQTRRRTAAFSSPTLVASAALLAFAVAALLALVIDLGARQARVTPAERPAVAAAPAAVDRFAPTSSSWEQTVGYAQLPPVASLPSVVTGAALVDRTVGDTDRTPADRLAPTSSSCLVDNPRCQEPAPPTAPAGR